MVSETPRKLDEIRQEPLTLAEKQLLVEQALGIFSQIEFHVLAEYVECIIPLMYAMYLAIVSPPQLQVLHRLGRHDVSTA